MNPTIRLNSLSKTPYFARAMHVIGYLRCSTEEQARSGLGLEAQRTAISDECVRRGWCVTWIVDDGYTGSNIERPGLHSALTSLRTGEATALVVSKLDRLSRSLVDFAGLMETARQQRWSLVALDLGVDMTTPSGALMANVMASFAEFERRLISQRTRDALQALRAQGRRLGRPRAVSPATSAAIGRWLASGCTARQVAELLNAQGVPTAHGGARWRASTVRAIATSRSENPDTIPAVCGAVS